MPAPPEKPYGFKWCEIITVLSLAPRSSERFSEKKYIYKSDNINYEQKYDKYFMSFFHETD